MTYEELAAENKRLKQSLTAYTRALEQEQMRADALEEKVAELEHALLALVPDGSQHRSH